jgi:hypothetical protein
MRNGLCLGVRAGAAGSITKLRNVLEDGPAPHGMLSHRSKSAWRSAASSWMSWILVAS